MITVNSFTEGKSVGTDSGTFYVQSADIYVQSVDRNREIRKKNCED